MKILGLSTSLRDETRRLLLARPSTTTLETIAGATNLPLGWLKQLNAGNSDDPGVCRIQTLYEFLSRRELLPKVQDTPK